MEIILAMFTVYKWQYQIAKKQMQILRFFYFNNDF